MAAEKEWLDYIDVLREEDLNFFFLDDDKKRADIFIDWLFDEARQTDLVTGVSWVTSVESAIEELTKYPLTIFKTIFLDHDLGGVASQNGPSDEKSGHEVVKWIIANRPPEGAPPIIVHSYNKAGAERMVALLLENGFRASWVPFSENLKHYFSLEGAP